jgi:hypothetical protein
VKRSGIRRPTLEEVRAYEQRQRERALARQKERRAEIDAEPIKRRSPLARFGRKAKREAADLERFRVELRRRSGGWCEAQKLNRPPDYIVPVCIPYRHNGTQAHHVQPEDRDRGKHDPNRGLWICHVAHDWAHANPQDAKVVGLLRPDRQPPG